MQIRSRPASASPRVSTVSCATVVGDLGAVTQVLDDTVPA
jgi:hypothetical protein